LAARIRYARPIASNFALDTTARPGKNRAMRTPNLTDRLSAAREAKKALLERAKAIAEDPERAERRKAREVIVAARNARLAERKAAEEEARQREAAERAAREAAEAAVREAARRADEEVRAKRRAEEETRRAAEEAEREAILAARRAGRKARKRKGKR
jgi:hypothetical protein